MKFADDIALGTFTSVDFDDLVDVRDPGAQEKRWTHRLVGFQLSFAISAMLHFVLASSLLYFLSSEIAEITEPAAGLIRVEFVPSNPQLDVEEEVPTQVATEPVPQTNIEQDIPNTPPLEEIPPESNPIDVAEASEPEPAEFTVLENAEVNFIQRREEVSVPSVESVQRALSELQGGDASRFYSYDCNKLEEAKEFNDCAPDANRDYSVLTRNPVYDYHNPAIEITRSRETVTTLARQSGRVSERLALSDLPAGLSSYVLEEVEQSIELYSNNSIRSVDHMNTMVDKSAAGAMARRLNDHWVTQQKKLLRSRRVENYSEMQFREKCRSYEKFIMAPTEFARCLSIGESALGFTIDF